MAERNAKRTGRHGSLQQTAPRAALGTIAAVVVATLFAVTLLVTVVGARADPGPSLVPAVVPATASPNPFTTGMAESRVIGQASFTTSTGGTTSSTMVDPVAVAFDASGDLWVVDRSNNRVLEYVPPFTNGMAASVVLGQSSFTTSTAATTAAGLSFPSGVIAGPGGSIWVADSDNNRVLEYVPPFTSGMSATLVLGQSSFTTGTAAVTATGLDFPNSFVFTPSGDLFLVDYGNNRVLEYTPPFSTDMAATLVLGQSGMTTATAATTATGMDGPIGIAMDAKGDLFVSGNLDNRVLEFEPPFSSGMAASVVFGQSSFTGSGSGSGATGMSLPCEVVVDALGDLWVADQENSRLLEFLPPFTSGMAAEVALGQTSLSTSTSATTQTGLDHPYGIALDAHGNIWAADTFNDRAVEFVPPTFAVGFAQTGLPSGTSWSVTLYGQTVTTISSWISFSLRNGSYNFSVGSVGGYTTSPSSGTVVVSGANVSLAIDYGVTIVGLSPSTFWLVVTIVLAIVAVIAVALAVRLAVRNRRAASRPPPQAVPPASPPPGAGSSPPPSS